MSSSIRTFPATARVQVAFVSSGVGYAGLAGPMPHDTLALLRDTLVSLLPAGDYTAYADLSRSEYAVGPVCVPGGCPADFIPADELPGILREVSSAVATHGQFAVSLSFLRRKAA